MVRNGVARRRVRSSASTDCCGEFVIESALYDLHLENRGRGVTSDIQLFYRRGWSFWEKRGAWWDVVWSPHCVGQSGGSNDERMLGDIVQYRKAEARKGVRERFGGRRQGPPQGRERQGRRAKEGGQDECVSRVERPGEQER